MYLNTLNIPICRDTCLSCFFPELLFQSIGILLELQHDVGLTLS